MPVRPLQLLVASSRDPATCTHTKTPISSAPPTPRPSTGRLKRAGLDYWPAVCVDVHPSWQAFLEFWQRQPGPKQLVGEARRAALRCAAPPAARRFARQHAVHDCRLPPIHGGVALSQASDSACVAALGISGAARGACTRHRTGAGAGPCTTRGACSTLGTAGCAHAQACPPQYGPRAGYSKFARRHYAAEGLYPAGTSTWLMFGAETTGLPEVSCIVDGAPPSGTTGGGFVVLLCH